MMRKKLPGKQNVLAALLTAAAVFLLPLQASAAVLYMPDVTPAMSNASYWSQKLGDPDRLLADEQDVIRLNQEIWKTSRETRNMAKWSQTEFDALDRVKKLLSSAGADADYFYSKGAKYDSEGHEVSKETLYGPLIALCRDPDVDMEGGAQIRKTMYAVCTTRTSLLAFPTTQALQDDPEDPDFDYNFLTLVKVNEPVLLRTRSADGKYYSALTCCGTGWISAEDVAICKDREEWLDAWNYPSDQVLVICDDKIFTEASNSQPETANRRITMGSRLQLAGEDEIRGRISNRTAHNNHVVWMPVRKSDGTYEKKLALIGENRKVSEGYLPLTAENIMMVAMNQLGDTYGWGSMLQSDDCSGFCRDVYGCFGLDLPRGCGRNNGVMKEYTLNGLSDADKAALIRRLPIGTILFFPGHEMLYLGYEGEKIYVLSSVSNIRFPGATKNTRVRGAVINTLDIWRGNNNSWLSELTLALIPFYQSSHADHVFSIAKAEIGGAEDCVYNGKPQTFEPEVRVNGTLLTEGTDYTAVFTDNTDAGTATLTIEGRGLYYGTAEQSFRIAKKAVTITARDQTVQAGDDILTGTDQAVLEGAVKGHSIVSVELTAGNTARVTDSGKIMPSDAKITDGRTDVTANYAVSYQKGKLTVTEKEIETKQQENPEKTASAVMLASMMAAGKTSLKLKWTKVPEASGYEIYMAMCNIKGKRNAYKLVKTIQKAGTVTWTKKKLQKNTSYRAYVRAYRLDNRKKKTLAKSPTVHAYTSGGNAKYTNPKKIMLRSASSVTLETGKSCRIKAAVIKLDSKKKIKQCTDQLRFLSADTDTADVSLSGRILAKHPGKTYIYVFTVNGIRKKVTVTVK